MKASEVQADLLEARGLRMPTKRQAALLDVIADRLARGEPGVRVIDLCGDIGRSKGAVLDLLRGSLAYERSQGLVGRGWVVTDGAGRWSLTPAAAELLQCERLGPIATRAASWLADYLDTGASVGADVIAFVELHRRQGAATT